MSHQQRSSRNFGAVRKHRAGVTLLEILIATVILLVAIGALGTQTGVAVRAASRVELESIASLLCESTADELVATQRIEEQLRPKSLSQHPEWEYTVDIREFDAPADFADLGSSSDQIASASSVELVWMTVTVWHRDRPNESRTSVTQLVRRRSDRFASEVILRAIAYISASPKLSDVPTF